MVRVLHPSQPQVFPGAREVRSITLRRSRPGSIHVRPIRWGPEDVSGQRVRTHGGSGAAPSLGHPILVDPRGSQRTHINGPFAFPCQGASYLVDTTHSLIQFPMTAQSLENRNNKSSFRVFGLESMLSRRLFVERIIHCLYSILVYLQNKRGLWKFYSMNHMYHMCIHTRVCFDSSSMVNTLQVW